jgi:hypothetical protein
MLTEDEFRSELHSRGDIAFRSLPTPRPVLPALRRRRTRRNVLSAAGSGLAVAAIATVAVTAPHLARPTFVTPASPTNTSGAVTTSDSPSPSVSATSAAPTDTATAAPIPSSASRTDTTTPTDPASTTTGATGQPVSSTGIVVTHQGPFPGPLFRVNTAWSTTLGDKTLVVYAGGKPTPDGSGFTGGGVRVYTEASDGSMTEVGEYLIPGETAPVTLTAAKDSTATVTDAAGKAFSFSLVTHAYTRS